MPSHDRGIFSIFAQAAPIYGRSLKFLAVITLLTFVPIYIFRMFLPSEYFMAFRDLAEAIAYAVASGMEGIGFDALVSLPVLQDATTFMLLFYGIELAFFPLSTAAAVYIIGKHNMQENPTFDGMFTAALPRFPKMLITSAIFAGFAFLFLSFGGFVALIGLYFIVGMVFYQHVVTDIGRWGPNAISISRHLVRGRWFMTLFRTLFIIILYFAASVILEMGVSALGVAENAFIHLPLFLVRHLLLSYFAIAFAMWYFDMKLVHQARLEEIQRRLEILHQQMDRFAGRGMDGDNYDYDNVDEEETNEDKTEKNDDEKG